MNALVTGGCHGLGKCFTEYLLSLGYKVYAIYNKSIDEALELQNKYDNIRCIKCDISKEDEVSNTLFNIDNIDILINNAAIVKDNSYLDKSGKEFLSVLSTNVVGTFLVTKYSIDKMNTNGTIINISSNNTLGFNSPLSMDYDASKAGVNMLTLNFSMIRDDIKVVAYAPGWIETESVLEMNPEFLKEELIRSKQEKLINPNSLVKYIINDVEKRKSGDIVEVGAVENE